MLRWQKWTLLKKELNAESLPPTKRYHSEASTSVSGNHINYLILCFLLISFCYVHNHNTHTHIPTPTHTHTCTILQVSKMFDIRNFELPTYFSRRVQTAIDSNLLVEPEHQAAFIREVVLYFQAILPDPKPHEYEAISRKIVDKYPILRDAKKSKYWVIML